MHHDVHLKQVGNSTIYLPAEQHSSGVGGHTRVLGCKLMIHKKLNCFRDNEQSNQDSEHTENDVAAVPRTEHIFHLLDHTWSTVLVTPPMELQQCNRKRAAWWVCGISKRTDGRSTIWKVSILPMANRRQFQDYTQPRLYLLQLLLLVYNVLTYVCRPFTCVKL